MRNSVSTAFSTAQSPVGDQSRTEQSTSVDHALVLLRQAVSDTGHTLDSLQAAMHKDRAYIHRVLNNDARCTLDFIVSLPDDVEAKFEELRAAQFGAVVVRPAGRGSAANHFVAGLLGLLGESLALPARADRMVKVDIPAKKAAVGE